MKNSKILRICFIGLMAALVYVASTYMRIRIPLAIGTQTAAIHFGNIFCLISGLLLGPLYGGAAAGIGSALTDLTIPEYISSTPFTLVFKFTLAFVCGLIAHSGGRNAESVKYNIIGGVAGSFSYVVLYLGKNFINNVLFLRIQLAPALAVAGWQALASSFNAVLAVSIATPLFFILKKALDKNNIVF